MQYADVAVEQAHKGAGEVRKSAPEVPVDTRTHPVVALDDEQKGPDEPANALRLSRHARDCSIMPRVTPFCSGSWRVVPYTGDGKLIAQLARKKRPSLNFHEEELPTAAL
jgi:hypothetical protein